MAAKGEACQVCGRRQGLRQDGTLRFHHVRGDACPGAGRKPFSLSCDAIDEAIAGLEAEAARWAAWWAAYRRGNMPPADDERARTARVDAQLARMRRRRRAWERRDWVQWWDPGTERMRLRPPEPGERGYRAPDS